MLRTSHQVPMVNRRLTSCRASRWRAAQPGRGNSVRCREDRVHARITIVAWPASACPEHPFLDRRTTRTGRAFGPPRISSRLDNARSARNRERLVISRRIWRQARGPLVSHEQTFQIATETRVRVPMFPGAAGGADSREVYRGFDRSLSLASREFLFPAFGSRTMAALVRMLKAEHFNRLEGARNVLKGARSGGVS